MIKEDFLYYIWKFKKFGINNLVTTDGDTIAIINEGIRNHGSGPDFLDAKIKINDTIWFGNIEMHIKSSDWYKHNHQNDANYDNVILHIVMECDSDIKYKNGNNIPCLELKNRVFKEDIKNYKLLKLNENWIPCEKVINDISPIAIKSTLEKNLAERLIRKSIYLKDLLEKTNFDWNQSFYIFLAKYFGTNKNSDAFETLISSVSINKILRENDDVTKLEALLFGQANLLPIKPNDKYSENLITEYHHLSTKYNLKPIPISLWKFGQIRPANFPTIRISQFANLLHNKTNLFDFILNTDKIEKLREAFDSQVSDYWLDHYNFGIKSEAKKTKKIGKSNIDLIIINVVIPTIYFYGYHIDKTEFQELAIDLLEQMQPENNSIIDKWKKLNIPVTSAFHSQALLELKKAKCDNKLCLECSIGHELMKKN